MLSISLTTAPILTAKDTTAPSCPTSSSSPMVTGQPTDKYSIALTSGSADRTASTAARISLREACLRRVESRRKGATAFGGRGGKKNGRVHGGESKHHRI